MSRLTKRTVIGVVIRAGDTSDAIKRLADYEDAEEQGRLVPVGVVMSAYTAIKTGGARKGSIVNCTAKNLIRCIPDSI